MVKTGPANSQPEPPFSKNKVDEVIKNLDDKKCPGPDDFDGVIVKRLHKYLPKFWLTLFNKCLSLGSFPEEWKKARVIAIPKQDRNKLHSVQGYRGISLLSIPGKCLEKLATERLNHFLESAGHIPPQQYGFTAGRSTVDTIKAVTEHVSSCRRSGQKCCFLALDIAGAFGNAWHPGILARLRKLNCPPNIYSLVRDFLRERMAHFILGKSVSSKWVTKGCPQGSVLAPTLWNIIINSLIALLSKAPNVRLVVYADNIMIMIQGPSTADILNTLDNTLRSIETWRKEHRLEISKEKSALMPMYARNRDEYKRHPMTVAWGINVVSNMRYLGVTLDCKLDWYPHSQHLELKLLRIRNRLVRCSKATWGMSFHNLLTIYKHAILPVITYAAEAWCTTTSKRARSKLLQIQWSYLLFITKAYRTVSSEALSAVAEIMPIDLAMLLHKDIRDMSRGQPTNAVILELKKIEIPNKIREIHPRDNHI